MRYLLILGCLWSLAVEAKQLKVEVSAQSAILINAETGAVLYEKESHKPCFPASTTKVATALYALEKKGEALNEVVRATPQALALRSGAKPLPHQLAADGTHMGLKAGEELPLNALIHGLMLISGNDAANVIAEYVSGSVPQFVEELNAYLRAHGILETHFCNPHGYHVEEHRTTASDMAKIAQMALKHPTFREVVKTVHFTRPETNKQPASPMTQMNRLLKPGPCFYPKAIGIKTGYHSNSGHTLVAAAEHDGRTLIAVIFGAPDSTRRFKDAIALFEAAFSQKLIQRVFFSKRYDIFSTQIKGGKGKLEAALSEDLTVGYYPAEEPQVKALIHWNRNRLPLREGEVVGEMRLVTEGDKIVKSAPLYAVRDLEGTYWFQLKAFVGDHFILILLVGALMLGIACALLYFKKEAEEIGE